MKLCTLCACLLATLLVSAATLGTIEEDGTGTSCASSATASKGNEQEYEDDYVYWDIWTTEAGDFDWYIEADSYASADLWTYDGWCYVHVIGDADAWCPSQNGYFPPVVAELIIDRQGSYDDDPVSDSAGGSGHFEAYEGCSSRVYTAAEARIAEGTESLCWGYAWGGTTITLSEN